MTPSAQANIDLLPASGLRRRLASHPAFSAWDPAQFAALEGHSAVIEAAPGTRLLAVGSIEPHIHFLLQGSVRLTDSDGSTHTINATDPDAGYPIARIRPALFSVECTTPATLLRIEQSVLRRLQAQRTGVSRSARFDLFAPLGDGTWRKHPLVNALHTALRERTLRLPVIPGIALKVRRALTSDHYQLSDITRIIAADPVISARLLQLSNSPVFRGQAACDSLQSAVVRLGINRVQNLVLALSSGALFRSEHAQIKDHLLRTWRHLLDIGALTAALARLNGALDPDIALLTGLLHEIGKIPILERAAAYPDLLAHPGLLEDILTGLGPELSAATLAQWQLAEGIVTATTHQHQWSYEHEGATDYLDLLLVAHIYALRSAGQARALPRLDETPAFAKITGSALSARQSLQIINDAAKRTAALKSLLS